jgi:hypothetical protein
MAAGWALICSHLKPSSLTDADADADTDPERRLPTALQVQSRR